MSSNPEKNSSLLSIKYETSFYVKKTICNRFQLVKGKRRKLCIQKWNNQMFCPEKFHLFFSFHNIWISTPKSIFSRQRRYINTNIVHLLHSDEERAVIAS